MKSNYLKSFSGCAIIIDLRNFSEISRRLLIQEKKPLSNRLKYKIYTAIFDFLVETLQTVISNDNSLLFDHKHTGDGFLFVTKHHRYKGPNTLDSFLLLLDIYLCMDTLVPRLNVQIIDTLNKNAQIVRGNRHLKYIRALFRDESGKRWRQYVDFSIGAHCGTIFHRDYNGHKILLGNTINQSSRFQALSTTFSDYNLFFSEDIAKRLSNAINNPNLYSEISTQWFKSLDRIEIKGLGPTTVYTVARNDINDLRKILTEVKTFQNTAP